MTLVLAAMCSRWAVIVGDQLITRADKRTGEWHSDHDTVSNKLIVVRTHDAIAAVGYAGAAYVNDIPTDEWIAKYLAGLDLTAGGFVRCGISPRRWGLRSAMYWLRQTLDAAPEGVAIDLLITGQLDPLTTKCRPILMKLKGGRDGVNELPQRRAFTCGKLLVAAIGVDGAQVKLREHFAQFERRPQDLTGYIARNELAAVIREVAGENRFVGADLSTIVFDPYLLRLVDIRFDPIDAIRREIETQAPDGFLPAGLRVEPWIIAQRWASGASVLTGAGETQGYVDGVQVRIHSSVPPDTSTGNFSISPLKRAPRGP